MKCAKCRGLKVPCTRRVTVADATVIRRAEYLAVCFRICDGTRRSDLFEADGCLLRRRCCRHRRCRRRRHLYGVNSSYYTVIFCADSFLTNQPDYPNRLVPIVLQARLRSC